MINKYFALLFVLFLSISFTSALNLDNVKSYDSINKKITIKNAFGIELFGLGSTIEEITLKSNTYTCGEYCSAEKEIILYEDGTLIDSVRFETIKDDGTRIEQPIREYKFYIRTSHKEKSVDDYSLVCVDNGFEINGTKIQTCSNQKTGSHIEYDDTWEEYKEGTNMKAGSYYVKLEGKKKASRTVDWLITTQGKELEEWAVWGSSTSFNSTYYYTFNNDYSNATETKGGIYNLTNIGLASFTTGKLNNATSMNGSSHFSGAGAIGRINTTGTTIAFWIKTTDTIFSLTSRTGAAWLDNYAWMIHFGAITTGVSDGQLRFDSGGGGICYTNLSGALNDNNWHRLVVTLNTTGAVWYFDGILNKSCTDALTGTLDSDTGTFFLGRNDVQIGIGYGTYSEYTGLVDDFRIQRGTVWTQAMVTEDWNSGAGMEEIANYITLNSPPNNTLFNIASIPFNCTATLTGSATFVNKTLWTNKTGTFAPTNTSTINGANMSATFTDGNYIWGCQVCDSDGDCGFSENRTLLIDTTSPSIRILFPTGSIGNGAVGNNWTLNYSISDTNIQTCWREYMNINTTIPCLTNTTFILNTSTTMKLWANDTAGNKAFNISTWNYKVFENSVTFNPTAYETNTENYTLNITSESATTAITSLLWYNGTSYASTVTNTSTNYLITNSLDVGLVATETANKTFFWQLTVYNGTGSYGLNTTTQQQTVSAIHLYECNSTETITAINFTAVNEETLARVKPFTFNGYFKYWIGNGNIYKNKTVSGVNYNDTTLCINPGNPTYKIDATIEYGDSNDTYITKDYNINDLSINNITTNITLYMLEAADSTTFILKVINIDQSVYPNAYIHIQRYFPGTDTYETTQIAKTNDDGKTVGFYKAETATYRHRIYDASGNLLLQTSPGKIFGESVPYTITFTVGSIYPVPWNDLEDLTQLTKSITYNNNTKVASYTYTDTSSTFISSRFYVEKVWLNQSNQMICNTTSALASAVLTCNLNSYNGTMIAKGYITRGSVEKLVELYIFEINDSRNVFDKGGLFLAWFIMLVGAFVFLYSFIAGIWTEVGIIVLVNLMGLAKFSKVFIFGAIALALIITIVFGREQGGSY